MPGHELRGNSVVASTHKAGVAIQGPLDWVARAGDSHEHVRHVKAGPGLSAVS